MHLLIHDHGVLTNGLDPHYCHATRALCACASFSTLVLSYVNHRIGCFADQGGPVKAGDGDEHDGFQTPVLAFHKGSLLAVRQGLKLPISLYDCSQY